MKKPRRKVPVTKSKTPKKPVRIVPHHPVTHRAAGQTSAAGKPRKTAGKKTGAVHPVRRHLVKKVKTQQPRKWSPGTDVACCTAEAFGLLLGWDADKILKTYWATAGDPGAGASIADTLRVMRGDWSVFETDYPAALSHPMGSRGVPLILGVTLPEPHAIAVTPDGRWWSWGEPFNPDDWPELVIEEAWAVLL